MILGLSEAEAESEKKRTNKTVKRAKIECAKRERLIAEELSAKLCTAATLTFFVEGFAALG